MKRLRWRWLARWRAWLGGYFWRPCPICARPFAGFEASHRATVASAAGAWLAVCADPQCERRAAAQNRAFYRDRDDWRG